MSASLPFVATEDAATLDVLYDVLIDLGARVRNLPLSFERWTPTVPQELHPVIHRGDRVYVNYLYGTPGRAIVTVFSPDYHNAALEAELVEDHFQRTAEEFNGG